ncbi:type II toxin-antitoxin system VapC family toxin [Dyadobacter luteus]|jgi:PIN domain nuclease of toxin-antitoxin system|uniref:Type II toxin-antitoxin system VapC family toxin n=1 Tax=Dyadobacter luteus TaxID=2259619 RepID=A0A3D8YFG6_9BACT|nr:type II toxin-antitoxin system VapC family toxin [Dyadobacter luteus]REA63304.1 type II toxin-antitoxin system VapC family toxin [Dyadobacter luteus]
MKYLLDTHVLLWYLFEEERLSDQVANLLQDSESKIYISAVTFWEISVKQSIGKLQLKSITPAQLPELCLSFGFTNIPLSTAEASSYYQLKTTHHKDPFDRMLIWQAVCNDFTFISNDGNMEPYNSDGLKLLW